MKCPSCGRGNVDELDLDKIKRRVHVEALRAAAHIVRNYYSTASTLNLYTNEIAEEIEAQADEFAAHLSEVDASAEKAEHRLRDVLAAIRDTRFMDPPDGGDPTEAEMVTNMREMLEAAERELAEAEEALFVALPAVRAIDPLGRWADMPAFCRALERKP